MNSFSATISHLGWFQFPYRKQHTDHLNSAQALKAALLQSWRTGLLRVLPVSRWSRSHRNPEAGKCSQLELPSHHKYLLLNAKQIWCVHEPTRLETRSAAWGLFRSLNIHVVKLLNLSLVMKGNLVLIVGKALFQFRFRSSMQIIVLC